MGISLRRPEAEVTMSGLFNTGRKYTSEGQPISWALLADGSLWFNDHARMICGYLTMDQDGLQSEVFPGGFPRYLYEEKIMAHYDVYKYCATSGALQFDFRKEDE